MPERIGKSAIASMKERKSTSRKRGGSHIVPMQMAVISVTLGVLALSLDAGAALSRMLSDEKAHNGVTAAHAMPVQGIDVSYWQGHIDWQKVSDAGVRFAYIKATEGGDRLDPKFIYNWQAAKHA